MGISFKTLLVASILAALWAGACGGASTPPITGLGADSGAVDSGSSHPADSGALDSTVPPADSASDSTTVDSAPIDSATPDTGFDSGVRDSNVPDAPGNCSGTDCSQTGQVCDPATNACVDCLTNADCAGSTFGLCDPTQHTCVECLGPADCPFDTPGCGGGFCGSCASQTDCPANNACPQGSCTCLGNTGCGGDAPTCIMQGGNIGGTCGCTADPQCSNGQRCSTSAGNGVCFTPCTDPAAACDPASGSPVCMTTTGLCVQCLTDGDCGTDAGFPGTPFCGSMGTCVQCTTDQDCVTMGTGMPFCIQDTCFGCRTYQDCPANMVGCNSSSLTCGSCSVDSDCPPGQTCPTSTTCIGGSGDAGTVDAARDAPLDAPADAFDGQAQDAADGSTRDQ